MRTGMILLAALGPLLFTNSSWSVRYPADQILSGRLVEGEPIELNLVPPEGTQTILVVASFETPRQFGVNGAWDVQRKTQVLLRAAPQTDPDSGAVLKQAIPIPWLDCTAVTLWAKHFGADGTLINAVRVGNFSFQPRCIEKAVEWQNDAGERREFERAVVVCRTHQRGYILDHERLPILSFLVSTGKRGATPLIEPGCTITVRSKKVSGGTLKQYLGTVVSQAPRAHGALLYDAIPLDSQNVLNMHGTDKKNYVKLGREASLGCVRTHQQDQKGAVALLKSFLKHKEGVPAWVVDHPQ